MTVISPNNLQLLRLLVIFKAKCNLVVAMKSFLKKICLAFFCISTILNAKSQELLNKNKDQIKKVMTAKNALLKKQVSINAGIPQPAFEELIFKVPKFKMSDSGFFLAAFYFTKEDKCSKYIFQYKNDLQLKAILTKFDNQSLGLKRINDGLHWVNASKNYEIRILKGKSRNGSPTTTFMTEFIQRTF